MEEDGAAIIDVGGESTRPGSEAVSIEEELERVMPVIEGIRERSGVAISIDTRKARVAEAALDAGADIINDVSALRHDPELRALAAQRGVPVILMHMRGEPRTMQQNIHYDDVVDDVARELTQWRDDAIAARHRARTDPRRSGDRLRQDVRAQSRAARALRRADAHRAGGHRRIAEGVHRPSHRTPAGPAAWPDRSPRSPRRIAAARRSFACTTCARRSISSKTCSQRDRGRGGA